MYTTTIGTTFLQAYNKRFNTSYTGRAFFESQFVPLFFDHQKYMMTAGNSPLENPKLSWEDMITGKKPFETVERRQDRIRKMIEKIERERADASIAIGYGVLDETAATASQITSIAFPDSKELIYLSWIGAALGIGVAGGITILFNHPDLLMDIFDGWKYYRTYLEKYALLKGNQINTWNAHWIIHRYDNYGFDDDDPTAGLNPLEKNNSGLFNIPTIPWTKVLFAIASRLGDVNLVGYLFNIGQTNTTIGFIPFVLNDINRPHLFYRKIFGEQEYRRNFKEMENLFGTAFGIRTACQNGSIGVMALEPRGLREYMPNGTKEKKVIYKEGDPKQEITLQTYLIWILAMLNNEKLWDKSLEIARLLLAYEAGAAKARTNRTNHVNQLLASTTSRLFLQNMIPIIEDEIKDGKDVSAYESLGQLVNLMPKDNFPYFNTLVRFQYVLLNK